ncbi:MAG: class I SAM-dependent methyltransferase [Verrucomicrobia bacterium]|nr:class I SAM-dependent methyltransferase [Verrucomicrobiota bacterium]
MKKHILYLFLLFITSSSFASDYLSGRIYVSDKRFSTYKVCLELIEHRGAKTLVETGTARNGTKNCVGDGCSTVIFADWAKDHGAALFSVDINPQAINESREAVKRVNPNVQFATQDSIQFLKDFNRPIDFLYLDSYDFELDNPAPSQLHHLNEIKAAYPFLHKDSIIMIDDCDLPHGGKGKLAIEFLTSQGWIVLASAYQTILIYPSQF